LDADGGWKDADASARVKTRGVEETVLRSRGEGAPVASRGSVDARNGSRNVSGAGGRREHRFECNVCFDVASDPTVTPCGHLYCWRCIHRWLEGGNNVCPVCKEEIASDALIALYGVGDGCRPSTRGAAGEANAEEVKGFAALLGLRIGDGDITSGQANQLLLSRILLMIGCLVVVCLLVI